TFIADLDVPVVVGGCTNYQTALHLMRTGAAGVIVGVAADEWSTTADVLGIEVPMATAIVDAAGARRDYLDETGGRYVHVIAAGPHPARAGRGAGRAGRRGPAEEAGDGAGPPAPAPARPPPPGAGGPGGRPPRPGGGRRPDEAAVEPAGQKERPATKLRIRR